MLHLPQHLPESTHQTPYVQVEWMTATEAARYLRVKRRTLLLWVRQGKVHAFALSGGKRRIWRFRKSDLDAVLLQGSNSVLCSASPSVLVLEGEER
jgi:excisionase family DNA binding protein